MNAGSATKRGFRKVQPLLSYAATHLDEDLSLAAIGARARLSPFHVQRLFAGVAGETLKQFTARLRLERAAAMLLTSSHSVLSVALACGFRSHETFTRLFHSRFGVTPSAYRRCGLSGGVLRGSATRHAQLVTQVGPCLKLYHANAAVVSGGNEMRYSVSERVLPPQPVLVARRRVKRTAIARTLGEMLGSVFVHAQRVGGVIAGQPFTRYLEWGPAVVSIESGLPVATAVKGEGEVLAETLPGGGVAFATHLGPYEQLFDAHAAVQLWIEENVRRTAGAPWEVYVTDPAEHPDPKDWRTDIFWPIAN
jgi:AraC family transcriptional regulator